MSNTATYIHRSNGIYLGFVKDDNLFSRDGVYMGWLESDFVWDSRGQFRGVVLKIGDVNYMVMDRFVMSPPQRSAKPIPSTPVVPNPPPNIQPIELPVKLRDAF